MKAKSSTEHEVRDIYATVTAKILASMEAGLRPWAQSWKAGGGAILFV